MRLDCWQAVLVFAVSMLTDREELIFYFFKQLAACFDHYQPYFRQQQWQKFGEHPLMH